MSASVHVASLEALFEFRNAFCTFAAKAADALGSVDMQTQRVFEWLDEQAQFWQRHVRKCEDAVIQAQRDLRHAKMMKKGDRRPDCTTEEVALKRATSRLHDAEASLQQTTDWQRKLPDVIDQLCGSNRRLQAFLETEYPCAASRLDHAITTLEEYLRVQAVHG